MEVRIERGPPPEYAPVALHLGGRRVPIAAVLDRWPGRDHQYLKVRAADGAVYILRGDEASGRWVLWLYDGGAGGARPPLSGG